MSSYGTQLFQKTVDAIISGKAKDDTPFIEYLIKRETVDNDILFLLDKSLSAQENKKENYFTLALKMIDKGSINKDFAAKYFEKIAKYPFILASYQTYEVMRSAVVKLRKLLPEFFQYQNNQIIDSFLCSDAEGLNKAFDSNYSKYPSEKSVIGFIFVFENINFEELDETNKEFMIKLIDGDYFFNTLNKYIDAPGMAYFALKMLYNVIKSVDIDSGLTICFKFADIFGYKFSSFNKECRDIIIDLIKYIPADDIKNENFTLDNQFSLIVPSLSKSLTSFDDELTEIFTDYSVKRREAPLFAYSFNMVSNYAIVIFAAKCGMYKKARPYIKEYMKEPKFCLEAVQYLLKEKVIKGDRFSDISDNFFNALETEYSKQDEANERLNSILEIMGDFAERMLPIFLQRVSEIQNEKNIHSLCSFFNNNKTIYNGEYPTKAIITLGKFILFKEESDETIVLFLNRVTKKGILSGQPTIREFINFFFSSNIDEYTKCIFELIQAHKNSEYEILASGISKLDDKELTALTTNITELIISGNPQTIDEEKEKAFETFFINRAEIDLNQCLQQIEAIVKKIMPFFKIGTQPPMTFNYAIFSTIIKIMDFATLTKGQCATVNNIIEKALPAKKENIIPNAQIIISTIEKFVSNPNCTISKSLSKTLLDEEEYQELIPILTIQGDIDAYAEKAITSLFTHCLSTPSDYKYKSQINAIFDAQKNKNIIFKFCSRFTTLAGTKLDITRAEELLFEVTELAKKKNIRFIPTDDDAKFIYVILDRSFSAVDKQRIEAINILMNIYDIKLDGNIENIPRSLVIELCSNVWDNVSRKLSYNVVNECFKWCTKDLGSESKCILLISLLKSDPELFKQKEFKALFKMPKGTQSYSHIFEALKEFTQEHFSDILSIMFSIGKTQMIMDLFSFVTQEEDFVLSLANAINESEKNSKEIIEILADYSSSNRCDYKILAACFVLIECNLRSSDKFGNSIKELIETILCVKFSGKWIFTNREGYYTSMLDLAQFLANSNVGVLEELTDNCCKILDMKVGIPFKTLGIVFAIISSKILLFGCENYNTVLAKCLEIVCKTLSGANIESKIVILSAINDCFMNEAIEKLDNDSKICLLSNCAVAVAGNVQKNISTNQIEDCAELLCAVFQSTKTKFDNIPDKEKIFTALDVSASLFGIRIDVIKCIHKIIKSSRCEIKEGNAISPQNLLKWSINAGRGDIETTAWDILCIITEKTTVNQIVKWVADHVDSPSIAANYIAENCNAQIITERWIQVLHEFAILLKDKPHDSEEFFNKLYKITFDIINSDNHPLYDEAVTILNAFE